MDRAKIAVVVIAVMASGCTSVLDQEEEALTEPSPGHGKGLEVVSFTATDGSLYPEQEAVVNLVLKNHHVEPVDLTDPPPELYNLGKLEVAETNKECPDRIEAARPGLKPAVECVWTLKAPTGEEIDPLNSRSYTPRLNLRYGSQITSGSDPISVSFKPGTEINKTGTSSKSYSNKEVTMDVEADDPIPIDATGVLKVQLAPVTEQNLVSENYTEVRITPASIIEGCSTGTGEVQGSEYVLKDLKFEVDKSSSFTCQISSTASRQVQRNVIVSTSYKYQQSPHVNIEVVSN